MNKYVYVLQYGAEIKAVSGNLKAVYQQLKTEMGIFGELNILSYSQVARTMQGKSYMFFYTTSSVPYKLSKHIAKKNFDLSNLTKSI